MERHQVDAVSRVVATGVTPPGSRRAVLIVEDDAEDAADLLGGVLARRHGVSRRRVGAARFLLDSVAEGDAISPHSVDLSPSGTESSSEFHESTTAGDAAVNSAMALLCFAAEFTTWRDKSMTS